jgi:nitroreductase
MNEQIIAALSNRYATKAFDPSKKISDADFATLKEALRLTPSAYGIQPWSFVWVENKEVRAKLVGAAYGQAQVGSADKFLVIAAKTDLKQAIAEYITDTTTKAGMPEENLAGFKAMMDGSADVSTIEWYKKQCYIALGFAMETASLLGIDNGPMEGFDPAQFDEILGLNSKGLTSTVLLCLGYRSAEDTENANKPKNRFASELVNITV